MESSVRCGVVGWWGWASLLLGLVEWDVAKWAVSAWCGRGVSECATADLFLRVCAPSRNSRRPCQFRAAAVRIGVTSATHARAVASDSAPLLSLFFFSSFFLSFFFAVSSFVSSFGRSGFFLGVVQVPRCRDFCAPDFRRFFCFVFFFCLRLPMAGRRAVPSRCRCRKKNNTGNR